jgi:hypothetical protein
MLEKITTDLETSKKLKELGFNDSESEFVYWKGKPHYYHNLPFYEINKITDLISCYTLEQILEKLPKSFNAYGLYYSLVFDYNEECIEYKWVSDEPYTADKIYIYQLKYIDSKSNVNWATTAAKLWIKLKEYEII